jgi:hypothetical protein
MIKDAYDQSYIYETPVLKTMAIEKHYKHLMEHYFKSTNGK